MRHYILYTQSLIDMALNIYIYKYISPYYDYDDRTHMYIIYIYNIYMSG